MNVNKKFLKVLFIFISIFLVTLKVNAESYNYVDEETNYKLIIEDDANLLSLEEINKLKDDMQPLTKYGNIMFKSINENNMSASSYAKNYYHNTFWKAYCE